MNAFRTFGTSFSLSEHPGCPPLMGGLRLRKAFFIFLSSVQRCRKTQTKHRRMRSPFPFGDFKQSTKSGVQNRMSGPGNVWSQALFRQMHWDGCVEFEWFGFWLEMGNNKFRFCSEKIHWEDGTPLLHPLHLEDKTLVVLVDSGWLVMGLMRLRKQGWAAMDRQSERHTYPHVFMP